MFQRFQPRDSNVYRKRNIWMFQRFQPRGIQMYIVKEYLGVHSVETAGYIRKNLQIFLKIALLLGASGCG